MTSLTTDRGYVSERVPTLIIPVASREAVRAKALRLLLEGRLVVAHVDEELVEALARGDGHVWHCGWDRSRSWWCDCPARQRCAHLLALGRVVVRQSP